MFCFLLLFFSEYEIVSPYEVDHQGVYISHEVAHHQRRRQRRSLDADASRPDGQGGSETVHFQLSGLGQDFHMELREASQSLIAPGFTVQVLGKNGTKSLRAYHQDDLCFYQGSLRSRVNSSVALSTCAGMVSLNTQRLGLQTRSERVLEDKTVQSWVGFVKHGDLCLICELRNTETLLLLLRQVCAETLNQPFVMSKKARLALQTWS